jgi:DNA-binding PucR family transcriptional regulator
VKPVSPTDYPSARDRRSCFARPRTEILNARWLSRYADLIKTLDAFIRLHGGVNAVARNLFLHRNTVRQRLRRIAKLTGADLANSDDRLALQLALIERPALQPLS